MTVLDLEKYKKDGRCPFCNAGSENVDSPGVFEEGCRIMQCYECDRRWNELYALVAIELY